MSDKWIERLVTVALALGAILSVAMMLAGCTAIMLVIWKLA